MVLRCCFPAKKKSVDNATVVRDCTGTYLQIKGDDFQICNEEIATSFDDGAQVSAVYRERKNCPALEGKIICALVHSAEGWVEVKEIE